MIIKGKMPVLGLEFELREITAGTEMDAVDICIAAGKTGPGNLELARIAASVLVDGAPVSFDTVRGWSVDDLNAITAAKEAAKKKVIPEENELAESEK
jgi:hypothetical protein